jgi:hypothetical protein
MNLKDFCLWNNRMRGYVEYPWYQYVAQQKHSISVPSLIERYGNARNIRAVLDFMIRDRLLIKTSEPKKKIYVKANWRLENEFRKVGRFQKTAPIYLISDAGKWVTDDPLEFLALLENGLDLSKIDVDPLRRTHIKKCLMLSGVLDFDERSKTFTTKGTKAASLLNLIANAEKI